MNRIPGCTAGTAPFRYLLIVLLAVSSFSVSAQPVMSINVGLRASVIAALGNRFQRIGATIQLYGYSGFAQVNAEVKWYYNFRSLGQPGRYGEWVTSLGLLGGYGSVRVADNPFLSTTGNQTGLYNSIGYAYNLYFNSRKTTQQTGTIAFQFGDISIISENDIFARPTLDRFRTGAFLLQYQTDNYQFAINCTMWTGQMGNKVTGDTRFPYFGYMDTTGGVYTGYSHGLLSGQFRMALDGGYTAQANAGIDAEQVRNFVQNRLIHDMIFLPPAWRSTKNCHIPMLDTAGHQYLYLPGQEIKAPHAYWNLSSGFNGFY